MSLSPKSISLIPKVSEKAYGLSQSNNTYVFETPRGVNRQTIAEAVEEQFEVTVQRVRIVNYKGKVKRTLRKGGRPLAGRTSDLKKAYVVLKEGDKLPIFLTEEEKNKKPLKAEKK